MAWAKKKLDWTWYEDRCELGRLAIMCGELAQARKIIKHIVYLGDGDFVIVSCKGIAPKAAKKQSLTLEAGVQGDA